MKKVITLILALATICVVSGCDNDDEPFDAAEQLDIDIRLIDEFLANNGLMAEVDEDTQLRYIINQQGTGANATTGNTVEVHYTGYFLDGTEFDTSIGRETFNFVVGRGDVIPGWDIGFRNYNVGSSGTIILPSFLAYGRRGTTGIQPNAVLVFDVEVIDIR
jgi:FKBP-type peptidyl-prolyl cis-trans isomerase